MAIKEIEELDKIQVDGEENSMRSMFLLILSQGELLVANRAFQAQECSKGRGCPTPKGGCNTSRKEDICLLNEGKLWDEEKLISILAQDQEVQV